jgi:hypothetical protein
MAIKVNAQVTGYGPQPSSAQALVIVTVEFDAPSEGFTFTVLVPSDPDEGVIASKPSRGRRISRGGLPMSAEATDSALPPAPIPPVMVPVDPAPAPPAVCAVPHVELLRGSGFGRLAIRRLDMASTVVTLESGNAA